MLPKDISPITFENTFEQDSKLISALFQAIVDKTYDSIIVTTTNLNLPGPTIIYVNAGFTQLTGYTPEEVIGKTPRIFQGEKTDRSLLNRLKNNLENNQPFRGATINYKKDGTPYYVEWNISEICDEHDRPIYYVALQKDVTEYHTAQELLREANNELDWRVRKRTTELLSMNHRLKYEIEHSEKIAQALRASEERHRIVSQISSDLAASYSIDRDGKITNEWITGRSSNKETTRQKETEIYGWDTPAHAEDVEIIDQAIDHVKKGENVTIQFRVKADDDTWTWIEVQFVVQIDPQTKQVARYYTTAKDIIARKNSEAQQIRQSQQISALSQMGAHIVGQLDLHSVLDAIAEKTGALLNDADVLLLLVEHKELVIRAASNHKNDSLIGYSFPIYQGFLGEVLCTNKPVNHYFESGMDSETNEPVVLQQLKAKTKACMAISLRHMGNTFGVIKAIRATPTAFTQVELDLFQSVAAWASIAIDNANKHDALQRRLQEVETLFNISKTINSTLDLRQILQQIVEAATQLLPHINQAVIHLPNEDYSCLDLVAAAGGDGVKIPELHLSIGEGLAGLAYQNQHTIYSPDVYSDSRFVHGPTSKKMHSMMAVPIMRSNLIFGTITVNAIATDAHSPSDQRILEHLCDNAATAIENARLFQYEKSQRCFAEGMSKFLSILGQRTLRESDIFSNILRQIVTLLECDAGHVLITRPNTQKLEVLQSCILKDTDVHAFDDRYLETDRYVLTHIQSQTAFHVQDTAHLDDWYPSASYQWINAFALVPLKLDPDRFGLIYVCSNKVNHFNSDRRTLLQAFASQSSIALQNARLYQNLEESLAKEQSARDQMVQAGKLAAMGRMVASVAHELNNPLQIIKNCLYLLQLDVAPKPSTDEYLKISLSEISRLSDLVSQLRDVYQPRPKINELIKIVPLLESVQQLVSLHLKQYKVDWHWLIDQDSQNVTIQGNNDQLKQVLLNLCLNGIEVMGANDGGTLFIDIATRDDLVGIHIIDTGRGITPENREALFDPFFTTKENGMGLGLAISYDIVQHHGGNIEVSSVVGKGTTFTVWLPVFVEK